MDPLDELSTASRALERLCDLGELEDEDLSALEQAQALIDAVAARIDAEESD